MRARGSSLQGYHSKENVPPAGEGTQSSPSRRSFLHAVAITARPRQWAKNLLVFAAPATGGVLTHGDKALDAISAFFVLCVVSSGIYFINDAVDLRADRAHPTKRFRPVPAGEISQRTAGVIGATLIVLACVGAQVSVGSRLLIVVVGYVGVALAYAFLLRNIVLLDIAAIAGGFVLRAIAGGAATDVPLSMWFLMVSSFGALFIATGKRFAELRASQGWEPGPRTTLSEYTEPYLRYMQYASSTVAISAYSLWAFEGVAGGSLWSQLSIVPFVISIFRYALLLDRGEGGTPEDLLGRDRQLQALVMMWIGLVVIGVYFT